MVGSGNTAITEALYLAEIASEVHILVRSDRIRAEQVWVTKAQAKSNIIFHMNTQVTEVMGDMMGVNGVKLNTGETLAVNGVFVAIGSVPVTSVVDSLAPEKDAE